MTPQQIFARSVLAVLVLTAVSAKADVIVDNDQGPPAYTEVGSGWLTSSSTGYNDGTYRWTPPGSTETATWTANLPEGGSYEVFVWYRPGTNRTTATKYIIPAADQTYTVFLDQTAGGFVWESLGTYAFNAGANSITLDAGASTGGTAVIADAVRFGGDGGGVCALESTTEVAPGVYHSVYNCPAPQVLHVLEFDVADPTYTVEMGFAQAKRNYSAKERTSQIAGRYDTPGRDVIGAINASHFDAGLYIHGMLGNNGNVIGYPTLSWPREAYVLQESGEAFVTTNTPAAVPTVRFADGTQMAADVFDYTCTTNTLAVYTPDWGPTTGSTTEGVEVIVEGASYPWRANKWVGGTIGAIRTGSQSLNNPIPPDGFVLAACPGMEADLLARVSVGDPIAAYVGLVPLALNNAKVICGGASGWLVKDGAPFPENWNYGHAPVRHPRTALAWNGTRHWFVTCDGRQTGYSVGMTYTELADFLVNSLQADHAVNLDGGGSTTLVVHGAVVNCPSDNASPPCTGTERAVPNALLLVARDPTTAFPRVDEFAGSGRALPWDDKFTINPVIPFSPTAPGGDGAVLQVMNAGGGYETVSLGASGDTDYTVDAWVFCDYRPDVAPDGFERVGIFARDDGNANFDSADLGGGNAYTLTYDSHNGRIRAGKVVDGVLTDFLESSPLYEPTSGWRQFRIGCYGDSIRYVVDGVPVATVTDSTHTRGRFGIGYHEFFATDANMRGTRVDRFSAVTANGDFDGDGDVDLDDYAVFADCMAGPGLTPSPTPPVTTQDCLDVFDFDVDEDVDLLDFAVLQERFTVPSNGGTDTLLTGFEGYANGAEVMFRAPRFSGSTSFHLTAEPNVRGVTDAVTPFGGSKSYSLQWQFVDATAQRWVRVTTFDAANLPNPTIELDKPIRLRLRLDSGSLRVTLGVRETGTTADVGQNGGTAGTIEWVGAASQISGAPQGVLLTGQPGVWQTLVFDPVTDPVLGFTGDGNLSSPTGKGTVEHLAFSSAGTAGPFTVYIDDIEQLSQAP